MAIAGKNKVRREIKEGGIFAYIRGRGSSQQDLCPWGHLSTWGARWNFRDVFPRVQGRCQVRPLWIGRGSSMINPKGNSGKGNVCVGLCITLTIFPFSVRVASRKRR